MDEINITPLTDIFLVLLIIMMVVAPMLNYRALPVRFASADAQESKTEKVKIMSLVVVENGDIQIEGEITARDRIKQAIQDKTAAFPDGVEIAVAPDASLDAMTFALNAVQMAGIQKVSVTQQTQPAAKQKINAEATPAKKT
jgi:biopolymer transport protein ExbD/biopolymer transport protein TolR